MGLGGGVASRLLSAALVAVLLASCTAYRPVRVDDLPGGLRDGDQVWITLKNGKAAALTVAALTDDAIRGRGGETVSFADIEAIDVATLDTKETIGKAGTALAVALGYLVLIGWVVFAQAGAQVKVP
jgi:hypothetical protein